MKILTHNLLQCNVAAKHCKGPKFPLLIEADNSADVERPAWSVTPIEFELDFLKRLIPKLNWPALRSAAYAIKIPESSVKLPQTPPYCQDTADDPDTTVDSNIEIVKWCDETDRESESWWKSLHVLLFEYELITGRLMCPGCNHVFPVTDSIPNMLLREDEI